MVTAEVDMGRAAISGRSHSHLTKQDLRRVHCDSLVARLPGRPPEAVVKDPRQVNVLGVHYYDKHGHHVGYQRVAERVTPRTPLWTRAETQRCEGALKHAVRKVPKRGG